MVNIVDKGLFPSMLARIEQLQTTARVLQSYARPAAVCVVFGIVGVVADEGQQSMVRFKTDVNVRFQVAAHPVFERVLYQ